MIRIATAVEGEARIECVEEMWAEGHIIYVLYSYLMCVAEK